MVAAAGDAVWANGSNCGKKFKVTCLGPPSFGRAPPCRGSVEVTIVDRCPSPCQSTLQLSKPAFDKITNPQIHLEKIIINYQAACKNLSHPEQSIITSIISSYYKLCFPI
ncbi:hypothetical protein CRG98_000002 [Punica granatum]|nr:hypothetical protein CRG98_000002 [Punica granatum]